MQSLIFDDEMSQFAAALNEPFLLVSTPQQQPAGCNLLAENPSPKLVSYQVQESSISNAIQADESSSHENVPLLKEIANLLMKELTSSLSKSLNKRMDGLTCQWFENWWEEQETKYINNAANASSGGDDIHFCCLCSKVISGLANYVAHRRQNCSDLKPAPVVVQRQACVSSHAQMGYPQHQQTNVQVGHYQQQQQQQRCYSVVVPAEGSNACYFSEPVDLSYLLQSPTRL